MNLSVLTIMLSVGLASSLAFAAYPPARPAELKELDRLVGTWKVAEFVSKKAEWTPEEVHGSGDVATTKWIMDGLFLEDRKVPANGSEHLGIWHFDQAEKAYHYTMFQAPYGSRSDFTFHWDDKVQAFDGTCQMPNGVTMHGTTRFPDKDTKQWHVTATDAAGKVYLDMTCKEVRNDKVVSDRQAPEGAYVDDAATSLQGFWRAQSYEISGKAAPAEALKQTWLAIEGNKLVLKTDGPQVECTFKTDPKQSPKQLDIIPKESAPVKVEKKVLRAIYELEGDELKISFTDADKRPTEFASKEHSGITSIVLQRQKR